MTDSTSARILVIDDDKDIVRLMVVRLQAEGYQLFTADNAIDGLAIAMEQKPDLILLDIMMPGMNGFETIEKLKSSPITRPIPLIMITSLTDRASKQRALEAGAEEFLSKPVDRADLIVRVRNLLRLKEYGNILSDHNALLVEQVRLRTAQLEEAYRDTVFALVRAAEHKDQETGHHVRRISYYCQLLAQSMELPADFLDAIFHASPMHDIGKIGIPDQVLLKPGGFNAEEWGIMRTHCERGANILANGTSPYTQMGAEIALNHHEHWDGSGYPAGLKGEEIPLSARIMQICDVYDALRSQAPLQRTHSA